MALLSVKQGCGKVKPWIISEDTLPRLIKHLAGHLACLLWLPVTSAIKTADVKHPSGDR